MVKQVEISIETRGKGLHPITDEIVNAIGKLPECGILNVFIPHTSASLTIQENADPSAREDLETFLEKLAPENQSWHRHTHEGPDDTTSHMKSVLTETSLNIPVVDGELGLGTWQGIYVWEHRNRGHRRRIIVSVGV